MKTNRSTSLIKSFKGQNIRIDPNTNFICLTDMGKAVGKFVGSWMQNQSTKEYLEVFASATRTPLAELLYVNNGSTSWAHPKIALRFAQWCSPEFAVQVDFWVDELLTTGKVEIDNDKSASEQPQPTPQRQLAPQRDIIDYINAAQSIGLTHDPIIKSLLSQRMAEELGGKKQAETELVVLTVRAGQLGFSQKDIGTGSALGKFVLKQGLEPTGKSQHGKYSVNVYDLTEELDAAICCYFS
jgi:hypothetical protein